MLKGIDQRLSAEIVHVLMLMGHGDDLVICDVNHPAATIAAETTYGKLIDMAGCDIPTAAAAILSLILLSLTLCAFLAQRKWLGRKNYATVTGKGDSGRNAALNDLLASEAGRSAGQVALIANVADA